MEEWRPVVGFPEYIVSNFGSVKRSIPDKKNHKCRVLKPWLNNKGYLIVGICNANGKCKKLVHRLVCEAFHGQAPTERHEVAHGDGIPTNIHESNLRWATRSENMEDARTHGTLAMGPRHGRTLSPEKTPRGERHGHAKLTEDAVRYIRATVRLPGSGRSLATYYGVSPSTICTIRSGKTWRHI